MAVAFTDPGTASFLYDDFDPEASLAAPDAPQLSHMSAREIAEYLDQHTLHTQNPQAQAPKAAQQKHVTVQHATPQPKSLHSSADKGWTPLSESTPMDAAPGAQPKDLLKSRLSRLAQSAHAAGDDDNTAESDVESDGSDDASQISHLEEDTPSKVRPPQLAALEKVLQQKQRELVQQQEQQLTELKELRDLKHFLLEMAGGSDIVESLKKGTKPQLYEALSKQDLDQRDKKLQDAQEQNKKLQTIISELEVQSKKTMDELTHQKEATEELKKANEVLMSEKNDLSQEAEGLHHQIAELNVAQTQWHEKQLSLEKDIGTLSTTKKQLESDIESQRLASDKEITILKNINEELKDESNVVKGTNMSLKEMVDVKDKMLVDSQVENEKLKATIDDLKKSLEKTTNDYSTLKTKSEDELLRLRGDVLLAVSPQRYPELLEKTSCGVPLYEDLELAGVDDLTLVEAHNMIKNVLINLGIPFSQTKTAVEGISKQLQREDILRQFASKTHKLLYNEDMSLEYYMDVDQRGKEHLSQCTNQMYKNLELIYAVVNKK